MLYEHSARQPRYPTQCGTGSFAPQHHCWFALDERLFICSMLALQSSQILASLSGNFMSIGTGSVSCNSVFVRCLGRFLHQEELMEPEATVQNP